MAELIPWDVSIEDGALAVWLRSRLTVVGQIEATGIQNTPIGDLTPAAGQFTDLSVHDNVITDLDMDTNIVKGIAENNLTTLQLGGDILGLMTDPKLLVMGQDPSGCADSYLDISGQGNHGTPTGIWASGDLLKQGKSWVIDPNGLDSYIQFPDNDDFSFGDGANDSPFTMSFIVEIPAVGSTSTLISKHTQSIPALEYWFLIESDRTINTILYDNSAGVNVSVRSNAGLAGGYHLITISYDGRGGNTAATGMLQYVDGKIVTRNINNNASYVSMENLTGELNVAALVNLSTPNHLFPGNMGMLAIDAVEMSATDIWRMYQYVLAAYSEDGVSL